MTEYKPTYEQLEKAVALFDHTIDSILEHAKYGSSLPSNATLMAQSHRLMVEDTEAASCELRHILAPPVPAYEDVEEIVGWVNVYQCTLTGKLRRGVPCDTKEHATDEIDPAPLEKFADTVPIRVTVKREKKRPVERSVTVAAMVEDGDIERGDCIGAEHLNPFWGHPECHGKSGALTFTWLEDPTT